MTSKKFMQYIKKKIYKKQVKKTTYKKKHTKKSCGCKKNKHKCSCHKNKNNNKYSYNKTEQLNKLIQQLPIQQQPQYYGPSVVQPLPGPTYTPTIPAEIRQGFHSYVDEKTSHLSKQKEPPININFPNINKLTDTNITKKTNFPNKIRLAKSLRSNDPSNVSNVNTINTPQITTPDNNKPSKKESTQTNLNGDFTESTKSEKTSNSNTILTRNRYKQLEERKKKAEKNHLNRHTPTPTANRKNAKRT